MSRAVELAAHLAGTDALAIVCHDNPDPDCLASAMALSAIATRHGVDETAIVYGGEISHQQNRAFVRLLDVDVHPLRTVSLTEYDSVAYVDHSRPGTTTQAPAAVSPDLIVDHHPGRTVDAAFVDVRPDYGATATIFVEYLAELDLEPSTRLASALLFALHRERLDFLRGPTEREYRAAIAVFPNADLERLERLYASAFTPETIDAIGRAITQREHRESAIVTGVGHTTETDALPQAADYLLNLEGVDTVLAYGIVNGAVRVSARSIDPAVNVGEILDSAFGAIGSVGGHHDMAGGRISLDHFADHGDETELEASVGRRLTEGFFDALAIPADRSRPSPVGRAGVEVHIGSEQP